jgi:hypothetical protein
MAKKLMLFVLVMGLAAFAQHGHGGMGGPPSGIGGGMGGGVGSGHSVGGGHDMGGPDTGNRHDSNTQSGPKSPDQLLQQNTKLADNLGKLFPGGKLPADVCSGFKNLGQCVAAIHVAHNLGIDFQTLKTDMTQKGMSLGGAIKALDPNVNSKAEAKKGQKQANEDLKS